MLAARWDDGIHDTEGYPVEGQRWAYLPDPQPNPTSWIPPIGRISLSRGSIAETGWAGWIVDFVKTDGTYNYERESRSCSPAKPMPTMPQLATQGSITCRSRRIERLHHAELKRRVDLSAPEPFCGSDGI